MGISFYVMHFLSLKELTIVHKKLNYKLRIRLCLSLEVQLVYTPSLESILELIGAGYAVYIIV